MNLEKTIVKCDAMTSFSSVVGNVTAFATEFFKGHFPAGFFKHIIVSEELTNNRMENNDVIKYSHPYMVIKPELDLDNTFTETLPRWYTDNHYIPKNSLRNKGMYTIFRDEDSGIYIHCIPTRIKINFNVNIQVSTVMSMYNLLQTIRTRFVRETYEYINDVHLQSEIPKHMMITLAKFNHLDLNIAGDRETFANYLNKNSMQGIEETINLSTGNSMYAFNYKVNILSSYPESPSGNKNMKDLIVDNCDITFPFSFDLWIPNKFLMELPNNSVQEQFVYEEDNSRFKYNIVLDVHYIKPKIRNLHFIKKKAFIPDINVEYDVLKFAPIVPDDLKRTLDFFKKENALTEDIFMVMVMCGNKLLPRELYTVDYENFIIKTLLPMKNTTYTLLLYGDLECLNEVANRNVKKYNTDFRNNDVAYGID